MPLSLLSIKKNAPFITLMPKQSQIPRFLNFFNINWLAILYKIITKMLSTSVIKALHETIHLSQEATVHG